MVFSTISTKTQTWRYEISSALKDFYSKIFSEVLNLPGNDLSEINPDLFGSAIIKLISVNLSDTGLTGAAVRNLMKKLRRDISRLSLLHSYLIGRELHRVEIFS